MISCLVLWRRKSLREVEAEWASQGYTNLTSYNIESKFWSGLLELLQNNLRHKHFDTFQRYSAQSNISGDTLVHLSDLGNKQVYTKTGYYKATLVAIKKINRTNINVAKPLLMEFKRVRNQSIVIVYDKQIKLSLFVKISGHLNSFTWTLVSETLVCKNTSVASSFL